MKAFVLDTDKTPLSPCDAARARQLLDKGKAAIYRRYPFTIILKRQVDRPKPKPLRFKLDPGSKISDVLGKWLIWDRSHWRFDETRRILKITDGLVDHFQQLASHATDSNDRAGYLELAQKAGSYTRQKHIAEVLKPQLPVTEDQLDQHRTLLNVKNGTINLTTGDITPHTPNT